MQGKNIKIIISYDGNRFYGWQKQKKYLTVQGTLEECIKNIVGKDVKLIGCGRTDSKVHAISYVANFSIDTRLTPEELKNAINAKVLPYIFVKEVEEITPSFHSRYSILKKVYMYLLTDTKSPFLRDYAVYIRPAVDIKKMEEAACLFCGEHDLKAFAASGSCVKNTVRKIYKIKIKKERFLLDSDVQLTSIEIEANGFLYKMARNIVGTLIYAGQGKISPTDVHLLITSKNRKLVPPTAQPEGLYLKKVYY